MMRLFLLLLASSAAVSAQPFTMETFNAGLGGISNTNGVAVADYDTDGDLDVFIVAREAYDPTDVRTWSRLYRNNGDRTFTDATLTSNLTARSRPAMEETRGFGYEYSASWGDYDNDGDPDLFLGHMGPDQLFENNGDGTFTDVTEAAGIETEGQGGALTVHGLWFDYDRDGDLDLYKSRWWDYGEERDLGNRLYRNNGDGTFEDVTEDLAVGDDGATWTAVALDADADGWLDLYLATDIDTTTGVGINRLLRNEAAATFTDQTAAFGLEDPNYGMGLAIADANRDGLLDLYLSNVATPSRFQRNPLWIQDETGGPYTNVAEAAGVDIAGWGWGTEFFDIENDGDQDLIVVTGLFDPDYPTYVFRSRVADGELVFDEQAESVGLAESDAARGLAVFDYDNDGDQDLFISNVFRAPYLYENHAATGRWLAVTLYGTVSNRDGLGATLSAWTDGIEHVRYHHGSQYLGQNLMPVHFGLGEATVVDSLVVRWPSGQVDRMDGVPVDGRVYVREGTGLVVASDPAPEAGRAVEVVGVHPNPATDHATVSVQVREPQTVRLEVLDALGRRVHQQSAVLSTGRHVLDWRFAEVASGVYLLRVSWGEEAVTRRVTVGR
ncbi:MAG: FG-GAP-like repeat-containing protein [Bacteroidota bacterium]